jgi:hypothetical protein
MMQQSPVESFVPVADEVARAEPQVAEVLLSADQAAALEEEAHRQGLTAGQLLRRLVADFLRRARQR